MSAFWFGATCICIMATPYLVYTAGIFRGKKQERITTDKPAPKITVIFSAYNEGKNIERRLTNLKACDYPYMELIMVDDKSSDDTAEQIERWADATGIPYHLIRNQERKGVTASYNLAIAKAETEIVVLTDADVIFKRDALHRIVERLISDDRIGAVTGDLQPDGARYAALVMEEQYRTVYGDMCEWESAHDSTFNFNGALIAFKRSATATIPKHGADDANLAFATIRNGYRAVYEKDAIVYENIPQSFEVQWRQKVRRAHGILTAIWENSDLLNRDRPFKYFFFLRIWMYFCSPILFVIGILSHPVFFLLAFLSIISSMCRAFITNQIFLIGGMLKRDDVKVWDSTTSIGG